MDRLPCDRGDVRVSRTEQLDQLEVSDIVDVDSKGRGKGKVVLGASDDLLAPNVAAAHCDVLDVWLDLIEAPTVCLIILR